MFCELLDRITSVEKLSFLAIDVANVRETAGSTHKSRIIGKKISFSE
jgi:hypothetical protein